MQGALTALNSSIIGAMRALLASISSLTSVPENQPPHSVTSAALRMGSMTLGSSGKRRPFSMPVKPAERDCLRHSSSDTSSLSSTRSSFHQAMGDMPSLAFMFLVPVVVDPHPPCFARHPLPVGERGGERRYFSRAPLSPTGRGCPRSGRVRAYSLCPFTAASYSLRAALTCGRLLTSGTATSHQCPPASVEIKGSVSMTITEVRSSPA